MSSVATERALVGHVLNDPGSADDIVGEIAPEQFGDTFCRAIMETIEGLRFSGQTPELGVVADAMNSDGELQMDLSSRARLLELRGEHLKDTSTENVRSVCNAIKDKAANRERRRLLNEMTAALGEDAQGQYDRLESEWLRFEAGTTTSNGFRSIGEIAQDQSASIIAIMESGTGLAGVATGITPLDNKLSGLREGLHYVAAPSGCGKSTLAVNIGCNVAIRQNLPVYVVSYEMSENELSQRIICAESLVPFKNYNEGNVSERQLLRVNKAFHEIADAPLYISDESELTLPQIAQQASRIKSRHGGELGLIIVDYVQIGPMPDGENRQVQVANFSRGLKVISQTLGVAVMALSQLNENMLQRDNGRPTGDDLRESRAMKNDAHTVTLLYRDEIPHPDTKDAGIAELTIDKNRSGPRGNCRVLFMEQYPKFGTLEGTA